MHQDTFKGSLLGCSENVSDTELTIACTINMSIDCNPDLNISAVQIQHEGCKDNKRKGVTVEDRYYMTKEYRALSNIQKLKLKERRGARGHQPNKRQRMDKKKSLKSQVAAIAHQLSA